MYSNFSFLHENWPELAQLGVMAETYLYSDPNSSMFKAGMLAEKLVQEIYKFEDMRINSYDSHYDRINVLNKKGIISQEIYRHLDLVRNNRNKASHEGMSSLDRAKYSVRHIFSVCTWFMEIYGDYTFVPNPYVEPDNISQQSDYADIIAEHEKKLEELEEQIKKLQTSAELVYRKEENLPVITEQEYKAIEAASKLFHVGLNDSIDCLELSVRASNALKRANIKVVDQIMNLTKDKLFEIRNLGAKSVEEVLSVQKRIRIEMKKEDSAGESNVSEKDILVKYFSKRDISVADIALDLPIKNKLLENGFSKLTDLLTTTEEDLKCIKRLGSKKISKILETRDQIIGPVLQKIRDKVITFENADDLNEEDIEEIIFSIFMNSSKNQFSLMDIVSEVAGTMELAALSAGIGRLLIKNKIVLNDNGTYELKLPSILEVASKMKNERNKTVLIKRINRLSLEETGKELNITRERVRQIEPKALNEAVSILFSDYGMTRFAEDRYVDIASVYALDEAIWTDYIGVPKSTLGYFKFKKIEGTKPAESAVSDESIHQSVREKIQNYLDREYIFIDGHKVKKEKSEIEDYIISKQCQNDTTLEEFFELYQVFIKENGLIDHPKCCLKSGEERTRENRITKSNLTLWKYKKRFRYYNTKNKDDFTGLYEILSLEKYHNTEFSAAKLLKMYPELMTEYDIRDEYELHNLIRKTIDYNNYPEIDLSRSPMLQFGTSTREELTERLLFEIAPISRDDFIEAISEKFGIKKSTVGANWLKSVDKYYHQGEYRIDHESMPTQHREQFLSLLKEDFYYIDEIRDLYIHNIPGAEEKYVSAYSLKEIGFMVYKEYVIRNYQNAQEYFRSMLMASDQFDITPMNRKFAGLQEYYTVLAMLRHNYRIVEVAPSLFVSYNVLKHQGVTRDKMKDFCERVADYVSDDYFTIFSLRNEGFDFNMGELPYADWFYASILREDERFGYQRTIPQVLFKKASETVSRKALILDIISSEKVVSLDSIINTLTNVYGFDVWKSDILMAISDSEVFFDELNNRLYTTYGAYKKAHI